MKKEIVLASAVLLFLSFLLTGCSGYFSRIKENITVKDSLALHGNCIIAGRVIDDGTNEPVRGANIVFFSKPAYTVTDLYGQFEIIDIEPGMYTLQVFCVGYVQKDIPNIEAKPDRLIRLDIRLESKPVHNK
jgi:hypothetical protein